MVKATVARRSQAPDVLARLAKTGRMAAYVGVPASTSAERSAQLLHMAGPVRSAKKRARLRKAATQDVNNAELLFLLANGSPARGQPPRPVAPSVEAPGNREPIARELAASIKAQLEGDHDAALRATQRAALAGQNAMRRWFTDPRNNWAPNAPSTIRRKGSDRPGIDTGATRAAIVGIVGEE